MLQFFDNLEPILKSFWFVAIPTSIIFIIQTAMTFLGADASDGTEADFDGDLSGGHAPFQLFSLRNLINFLLGFSWTGISFYNTIENKVLLVVFALAVGVLFVMLFFFIIKQVQELAEDNSFKISNALYKTAEVYIPIPAIKSGTGKVSISINGSMHELDAMTEHERIATGTFVMVVGIHNHNILIVEPIK